jgi:hypothetical protein
MPLFRVTPRKAINDAGGRAKWSNLYYINASSVNEAAAIGVNVWVYGERLFHRSRVFCYEVYATSLVPADNVFTTSAVPEGLQRGGIVGAGDQLPLFNVLRVDLPVLAGGRPSRKFYRPTLEEGDQINGALTNAPLLAAIAAGMAVIQSTPEVRDESGNFFSGHVIKGITSRRLGRDSSANVPSAPPQG